MKTEYFKKKLEAEKAKLESEMQNIGRRNPGVPDDWEPAPSSAEVESDPVDQADVVVNRENNAAVLADLEARYDATLTALERIEKGTYGVCEVCGSKIEAARLEANPSATTCSEHMR
ncbi:hypothetical protein A3G63_01175 [Candidatus Kaiserbacteria bacterium RIFCSPLOWO2_12_FULL_52_8]|uniref:Zinc finger DksA/TraR C4-type domain-containing protein n=1 Tax=Candidatus Kaiserbacteria bacterium RIFCSPHIGHO2_01_FULL_53_31 TaxID=1798481 RepID=A0A1F6CGR6_9BACT|nr:MAG: hypothetical protein A2678_01690 [Candidatus Kaiserbacteria bacterium RIFCSPHIGHO2_01_FULL_53_31]OGG93611.1 MAG: hypothetical protein A3G63_01175 [Candidatus Kaiserbacteria bacterium RIFCSPLOWO2_12_FULL_52_8]